MTGAEHFIDQGQDLRDFVGAVEEFDDHWQVERDVQQTGLVNVAGLAETRDPSKRGHTADAMLPVQHVDDPLVLVARLAAIDADQRDLAVLHTCLASITPAYAAPTQASTLNSMLAIALA